MTHFNRRDFLKIASNSLLGLSGLIGLSGLFRFLSYEPAPPPPLEYPIGPIDSYPPGSRTVLTEIPALLIHDPEGFIALSLTCPHLGCTVENLPTGFECPCHGSRFDPSGQLLAGPAAKALQPLQIKIKDGQLFLSQTTP